MNADEALPQFQAIMAEYREIQAEVEAMSSHREKLRVLLQGYLELFPEFRSLWATPSGPVTVYPPLMLTPEAASGTRPRGQEAVKRVLVESPGKWWTVGQMVGELTRRGWQPDTDGPASPAVRTALERLARTDKTVLKARSDREGLALIGYCFQPSDEEGVA